MAATGEPFRDDWELALELLSPCSDENAGSVRDEFPFGESSTPSPPEPNIETESAAARLGGAHQRPDEVIKLVADLHIRAVSRHD
ncbi:hypothetical protein BDK89_2328 [Ilumatobacter fluminis]|uniref:Uncharacterized protein n=1 Tax=Ilumatobacter fluminis TaxID=467091 RepID=A0A4R7I2H4_9ACTN|nr:hypothetical protein BDK89_2328 [Ilumatobacter fluminis]